MVVFFNCCYAQAAIKSYPRDLMSRNNTLSTVATADRRKNFQRQFSFNTGLNLSATEDSDCFERYCARLSDAFSQTWLGKSIGLSRRLSAV